MKKLVATFIFLATSLVLLAVYIGVPITHEAPLLRRTSLHMYDDEKTSIEKIHITVFYFIPKDVVDKKDISWKSGVDTKLKDLLVFHTSQFGESSKITYDFFPEEIIGLKTMSEYESLFEQSDKDALTPIKEELTNRVLTSSGDLYIKTKGKDTTTRNVYLVVLEGKGAAGNDDFALISRSYLTDDVYKEDGSTYLAHEFYHTLGMPDNYLTSNYVFKDGTQVPVSIVTKKDIMGQVNIPIMYTHIEMDTLKKMGL